MSDQGNIFLTYENLAFSMPLIVVVGTYVSVSLLQVCGTDFPVSFANLFVDVVVSKIPYSTNRSNF